MSFFNKFNDTEKINLFLGDFLVRHMGYPTRTDVSKLLMKEMKENIKGYIKDENSLFQVSQIYLDGVISSRSSLLKKIKNLYETNRETRDELLKVFSDSNKINAVFSTNYDVVLDNINSNKVVKLLPTDEMVREIKEDEVKCYKLLGDIEKYNNIFVSVQDFRKLKVLDFYKMFFNNLKKDLERYPTVILGLNLNDVDFLDILEFLLSEIKVKDTLYAVSNSNVLKTKTIERLNGMGVKLLPHSEEDFFKELRGFTNPLDQDIIDSEKEVYIGKKLFR